MVRYRGLLYGEILTDFEFHSTNCIVIELSPLRGFSEAGLLSCTE